MLEAAISYASRDISVFPCAKKMPLTGLGGFKNATVDVPAIIKWWTDNPSAQIGIPTGEINHLVVLDIDGPLGEIAAAKMSLQETFTVETSPGHRQLWFEQPLGVKTKCSAKQIADEIDIRGDGGYVIAPPSVHHVTNQPYRVLRDLPWAPMPARLLDQQPAKNGSGTKPRDVSGPIPQGQRHATLLSLAGSMAKRALPDDVIFKALSDVNQDLAKPPLNDAELVRMVEYVSGKRPATSGSSVVLKCLKDVESKEISWLWKQRFPLGKLSVLAGDPGLGKSAITDDFSARVSRGRDWPDGSKCPRGSVVILSAEDDPEDTIRPRVEAAGGDLTKIHILEAVRLTKPNGDAAVKYFSLDTDIPALESAVFSLGDVRLIIVDPISAYLGSVDSHKNSEVRSVLHPLSDVAARAAASIIAITHLNKKSGPALYRIVDSIAFMATARAAWLVARNPDKPDERLMLPGKANLGPDSEGLGLSFTLVTRNGSVAVEWGGATNVTPDAMLSFDAESRDERSARAEATEWLRNQLESGPQPVTGLQEAAEKDGFSWATVRRAKDKLSIRSYKLSVAGGWAWELESPSRARGE